MKTLPKGCDYQGRYPEAAECCTEIGTDDKDDPPMRWPVEVLVLGVVVALIAIGVNLWAMSRP